MTQSRLAPDTDGKIPCNCCTYNGYRRNMETGVRYVCNYCNGTNMRIAPKDYKWGEDYEANLPEPEPTTEERLEYLEERVASIDALLGDPS